jgi:hypothetical protein
MIDTEIRHGRDRDGNQISHHWNEMPGVVRWFQWMRWETRSDHRWAVVRGTGGYLTATQRDHGEAFNGGKCRMPANWILDVS